MFFCWYLLAVQATEIYTYYRISIPPYPGVCITIPWVRFLYHWYESQVAKRYPRTPLPLSLNPDGPNSLDVVFEGLDSVIKSSVVCWVCFGNAGTCVSLLGTLGTGQA